MKLNWKLVVGGAVFACIIAIGLFQIQSASALMFGGVSLTPVDSADGKVRATFNLIIEPGKQIQDSFYVQNSSQETLKIAVFPSGYELKDGKVQEVPDALNSLPEPGKWITVSRSELVLSPNTKTLVSFTVDVPESADVGDQTATLFVQDIPKESGTKGSGLGIKTRTGVRVYMTVPGEIKRDLVIHNISHKIYPFWKIFNRKLSFSLDAENKGNVMLSPLIDIKVRGLFGMVGEQKEASYFRLFRGQRQVSEKEWIKRAPYFGRFVVTFDMHLGERKQVNIDRTEIMLPDEVIKVQYVFWVFPWQEIIALILFIFILYFLQSIWLYWVIIRRLRVTTRLYTVVKGDTVTKIAGRFGINPKTLAKFNMLRWPYDLNSGDQLLIPTGKVGHPEWRMKIMSFTKDGGNWRYLLGHLFHPHTYRRLAEKNRSAGVKSDKNNYETLIADKGDTVADVAEFAGISIRELAKYNSLKPPYRLRAGQELKVPKKKSSRKRKRG